MLPSPNFGDRRSRAIDALILHYTGMASGAAALARLLDPASEVSAHYLVWEDGRIDQLVAEADRAWHAGRSFWAGERDMNSVSVGIEIVNGGHEFGLPPYPAVQIAAVVALVRDIRTRHAIVPTRVLGHSDIAPARKDDPGEHFPWPALMDAGMALRVPPVIGSMKPASRHALQATLAAIGYECPTSGADDEATRAAIRAFQRRWRPQRGRRHRGSRDGGLRRSGRKRGFRPVLTAKNIPMRPIFVGGWTSDPASNLTAAPPWVSSHPQRERGPCDGRHFRPDRESWMKETTKKSAPKGASTSAEPAKAAPKAAAKPKAKPAGAAPSAFSKPLTPSKEAGRSRRQGAAGAHRRRQQGLGVYQEAQPAEREEQA